MTGIFSEILKIGASKLSMNHAPKLSEKKKKEMGRKGSTA